jgi:ATPase family protein associated with various cellular activities (AAA)/tetratricopeptide repeat protein
MVVDPELLEGLEAAVAASPDNVPLRLHLGLLLLKAGRHADALEQCAAVLQRVPGHGGALDLAASATMAVDPPRWTTDRRVRPKPQATPSTPPRPPTAPDGRPNLEAVQEHPRPAPEPPSEPPPAPPRRDPARAEPVRSTARAAAGTTSMSIQLALGERVPPETEPAEAAVESGGSQVAGMLEDLGLQLEEAGVTFAQVGGMASVKGWLASGVPVSQSERGPRRRLHRALRGGLLVYGPPGCGKSFLARATAGELGVGFLAVDLAELLERRPSEVHRLVNDLFQTVRLAAPCLLFLDQLDTIGDSPTARNRSFDRGVVDQFVSDLQGLSKDRQDVIVVAASENPWDVDPLLRDRFGRKLLVLPPSREAREAIIWDAIGDYPVDELNVPALAGRTEGFSAADVILFTDSAIEIASERANTSGSGRPVGMNDFNRALLGMRPSPPVWLALARDFVLYAGHGGVYEDLLAYLRVRT